jgi:UDP-2,3-diacylglucosamine pyrophosphatase LpxH
MDETTRIVISDLHIGRADDFDIFHSNTKVDHLRRFIERWRAEGRPAELIINGDFVDFLQLTPWEAAGRAAALVKIKDIVQASAEVFRVLGALLNNACHRITVLLGNHDVELAYQEVWEIVRDAILKDVPTAGNRLTLVKNRVSYVPTVNGVLVHIEHGNENDPWNAINYLQLFNDAEKGTQSYRVPPGTQFVYDVMNEAKARYRFVDLLKPEVPAVPLLLLALRPSTARELPQTVGHGLAALGNGFMTALRRRITGGPPLGAVAPTALGPDPLAAELANLYAAELKAPGGADADDVESFFSSTPAGFTPAKATLGRRLDAIKMRFARLALFALTRSKHAKRDRKYFEVDRPNDARARDARKRLVGNVKIVVFGHTHEALKTEFPEGLYLNSGTWATLLRLPAGAAQHAEWLESLVNNDFERETFLTYILITPCAGGVSASLNLWTGDREDTLWAKTISA